MSYRFDPLPTGFVLGKPIEKDRYKPEIIYQLEQTGQLIITRKRDGWKLFVVVTKKGVKIYTAGLNEVDERLNHIKEEVAHLNLPVNTVLVGEVVADSIKDNRGYVISVMSKSKEESLALQRKSGLVHFVIFGVVFYEGKQLTLLYEKVIDMIGDDILHQVPEYVWCVERLRMSFDKAKALVEKEHWEGLVLYSKDFVNEIRLDGKDPKRPKGCYKWKPILEGDFIVRNWIPRKDGLNMVKEVMLWQIDPTTGKEFECGKLGAFTNEMRRHLAHQTYPLVMEVEFEDRFPKSGKLCNSRFSRVRDDKPIHECIAPQSYPKAIFRKEGGKTA